MLGKPMKRPDVETLVQIGFGETVVRRFQFGDSGRSESA
jgi:hypothetical protein